MADKLFLIIIMLRMHLTILETPLNRCDTLNNIRDWQKANCDYIAKFTNTSTHNNLELIVNFCFKIILINILE